MKWYETELSSETQALHYKASARCRRFCDSPKGALSCPTLTWPTTCYSCYCTCTYNGKIQVHKYIKIQKSWYKIVSMSINILVSNKSSKMNVDRTQVMWLKQAPTAAIFIRDVSWVRDKDKHIIWLHMVTSLWRAQEHRTSSKCFSRKNM